MPDTLSADRLRRASQDWVPLAALASTAGMRSMTAPAALARSFIRRTRHSRSPGVAALLALAAGELIADKLPQIADRIDPLPLLARAASGAVVGYVAADALARPRAEGAIVGAAAAVATAALTYQARRYADRHTPIPDRALGLLEDVLALGMASWAASRLKRRRRAIA